MTLVKLNKIKQVILILALVLILFLIYQNLWYLFYSLWYYNKAINFFWSDKVWLYDKWNSYYNLKDYENAKSLYLKARTSWFNLTNFFVNYNLWNTYYRIWEKASNIKLKYENWLNAVKYYANAIAIWEKIKINNQYLFQAKKNLEFVLNKLKDLTHQEKNKQEKNKQWNNKNNNQSNENNNSKNNNQKSNSSQAWKNNKQSSWSKQEKNRWSNPQRNNKSSKQQNWKNTKNWLSENKQWNNQNSWKFKNNSNQSNLQEQNIYKALQEYEKQLLQQQKYNIKNFYDKRYQNQNQNPFNQMFNDPFFQDDQFFEWLPFWNENNVKDR